MTWVSTDDRLPTEADADEYGCVWVLEQHGRVSGSVWIGNIANNPECWPEWHPKPRAIPPEPPVDEQEDLVQWAWRTLKVPPEIAVTWDGMEIAVEAMRERGWRWNATNEPNAWAFMVKFTHPSHSVTTFADSLPLATLKAARRALG